MWYRWKSLEEFNAWHAEAKHHLGIPRPGRGLSSGRERPTSQWTTAYTEPYVVSKDDVRAVVKSDALGVPGVGEPCGSPIVANAEEQIAKKSGEAWVLKAEAAERIRSAEKLKEEVKSGIRN